MEKQPPKCTPVSRRAQRAGPSLCFLSMSEDEKDSGITRRDALKSVGLGGAALGAGFLGGSLGRAEASEESRTALYGSTPTGPGYDGAFSPPSALGPNALDAVTIPPARDTQAPGTTREYSFAVTETTTEVAAGATYEQWTYNGTAPGPTLRATEGDTFRITLINRTERPHNLHLHGRHLPEMDGWEPIPGGEEFTYVIEAGPAGVHPYHCHTPPLAHHVARGLYGTMIVDPIEPRPSAEEFVLLLSGWDLSGTGSNDIYTWNGIAGFFAKFPIKVPVGELVRLYITNMTEYEPVASFHLHAQMFDSYRNGTRNTPDQHTDTVTLSQGERTMVEFRLPHLGRYMFHPHQHHMAERGAMGWIAAI